MIEKAIGDTIALDAPAGYDSLTSFRRIMRHYHINYPWYQFGIDLALGSGIDYPVTDREKAFAPLILKEMMETATVKGRPVVKDTQVILDAREDGALYLKHRGISPPLPPDVLSLHLPH